MNTMPRQFGHRGRATRARQGEKRGCFVRNRGIGETAMIGKISGAKCVPKRDNAVKIASKTLVFRGFGSVQNRVCTACRPGQNLGTLCDCQGRQTHPHFVLRLLKIRGLPRILGYLLLSRRYTRGLSRLFRDIFQPVLFRDIFDNFYEPGNEIFVRFLGPGWYHWGRRNVPQICRFFYGFFMKISQPEFDFLRSERLISRLRARVQASATPIIFRIAL